MPHTTTRRVEFADTDAAGIAHFASFYRWMESAEHESLRAIGLSVMPPAGSSPRLTWPRVATECQYTAAARFEDDLTIVTSVEHLGDSSVRYRFDIRHGDDDIAVGRITAVCCDLSSGQLKKVSMPDAVRERLETLR